MKMNLGNVEVRVELKKKEIIQNYQQQKELSKNEKST